MGEICGDSGVLGRVTAYFTLTQELDARHSTAKSSAASPTCARFGKTILAYVD